jgi:hypothetical protein
LDKISIFTRTAKGLNRSIMITKTKRVIAGVSALLLFCGTARSQLNISSGATFNIQSGAIVTVQGDITSSADITGAGKVVLKGSANQNVNMNGFTIPNLEIDNAANATLTGNTRVTTDLLLTNGRLILGNFDLTLGAAPAGTVTGAGLTRFVVTNGTGRLVKTTLGATAFSFPVGNGTTTYNPISISNSGTADNIGVRCLTNGYTNGLTGPSFTKEAVDASWDVTEATAGGSNLSMTATWNASDELPGFQRTRTGISNYITSPAANVGWDLLNSQTAAASGTDPYSITRTGVSNLGAFAVGTRPVLSPLLVTPKVFLQGPFNTGTGVMGDNLRTSNLIPLLNPYDTIPGFTASGSGGGERSTATVVGAGAPAGNDAIVDWVLLQLHQASDSAIISTAAALLQRDGDIVQTDGITPANIPGFAPGNYFISVLHRNHLGVRSAGTLALAKTTPAAYNFTNILSNAFVGNPVVPNPAMATLSTGVFGLFSGNTIFDRVVRASGPSAINDASRLLGTIGSGAILSNVYNRSDVNMDGVVRASGPSAINDYSKLLGTLGALSLINQPIF